MTTVRDARTEYFARAGFAPDGGYGDRWVRLKAGGRTVFVFPNTAARVRSVKLHDLHHIVTGYDTSWVGEAEIGAWELASGCGRHYPAWVLNLGAVAIGALLWPRRVAAAFRRGRRSDNLYAGEFREELLDLDVEELRRRLRLTTG
jgi:ubiquinone biosynthesis protein Coq4